MRSYFQTANRHFIMMTAICTGAFVSHFTAGVMNTSLPYLAETFRSDLGAVQWVTIGYLLTVAALLPVMGSLGDRFGHRFIHNLGYILFTVSSLLAPFSPDIRLLLGVRIMMAVGASMFHGYQYGADYDSYPCRQKGPVPWRRQRRSCRRGHAGTDRRRFYSGAAALGMAVPHPCPFDFGG